MRVKVGLVSGHRRVRVKGLAHIKSGLSWAPHSSTTNVIASRRTFLQIVSPISVDSGVKHFTWTFPREGICDAVMVHTFKFVGYLLFWWAFRLLNRRMGMPLCERYYMCIISIYMKLIPSCLRFEVKIHTLIVELDNLDFNQGLT